MIVRQSAHRWRWSQPHAPVALYSPRKILIIISVHFRSFLVSVRGWRAPSPILRVVGRVRPIEKCNDIGSRTSDLSVYSIIPWSTTLPRGPLSFGSKYNPNGKPTWSGWCFFETSADTNRIAWHYIWFDLFRLCRSLYMI
jgi:hypothetical protein